MKMTATSVFAVMLFCGMSAFPALAAEDGAAGDPPWQTFFPHPYLGLDYDRVGANYNTVTDHHIVSLLGPGLNYDQLISDTFDGLDFHMGARFLKYFGAEAGYLWTGDQEKKNLVGISGLDSVAHFRGFTFDGLGYLPLGDSQRFELIGTVGVTALNLKAEGYLVTTGGNVTEEKLEGTEPDYRIGGGAQYWLTDRINARLLTRYQGSSYQGIVASMFELTAGLNFQF